MSATQLWLHSSSPQASSAVEQVSGWQDLLYGHCCVFNCSAFIVKKILRCADESQCFSHLLVILGRWGKFSPPAPSVQVLRADKVIIRMHDKYLHIVTNLRNYHVMLTHLRECFQHEFLSPSINYSFYFTSVTREQQTRIYINSRLLTGNLVEFIYGDCYF